MKKKEIFIQDSISVCGACSIASIISHYDGYVPLESIIEDTFTDKNGSNALEIVKALKKYGFIAYGMKIKLSELNNFPVIAQVHTNGLDHFLVIYGISKNKVLTMDPAVGKKCYEKEEFKKIYSKNIIVCNPTSSIIKYEKNKEFKKQIKRSINENEKRILLFILLSVIIISLNIFYSFYLKITTNSSNMIKSTILFGLLLCLKTGLTYITNNLEIKIIINIDKILNKNFLDNIFKLRISTLNNKRVGEIIKKIEDMNVVKDFIMKVLLSLSINLLFIILTILILIKMNLKISLLLILILFVYALISILITKKLYKMNIKNIECHSNYMGNLNETLCGINSVKHLNATSFFQTKLNNSYSYYLDDTYKLCKSVNKTEVIKKETKEIAILIINFFGLLLITKDLFTIIDLFVLNSIIAIIFDAAENVLSLYPDYLKFKAVFRSASEFLDIKKENIGEIELETFKSLKIDNMCYSYDSYNNELKNINLSISNGEKVFITGSSGSGKSTLMKCICGICENYTGSIKLNDLELSKIPINKLREKIIYIGQDEKLFTASIKENITLGEEKDIGQIEEITKLNEIISKKSIKDDYILLEDATNLSKGEKARIILARALYKKPEILILDETLSNLDEKMENEILNKLLNIKELTLFYITHRDKKEFFNKEIKIRKDGKCEIK